MPQVSRNLARSVSGEGTQRFQIRARHLGGRSGYADGDYRLPVPVEDWGGDASDTEAALFIVNRKSSISNPAHLAL